MATIAFPYGCIPEAATLNLGLSHRGYRIYAIFIKYRNRQTGQCNPNEATLAAKLGQSVRTLQRGIAELRSLGMIAIQKTLFGNRYELTTPDRWHAPGDATKVADADATKVAGRMRQKCRDQGGPSLFTEPDVYEPKKQLLLFDTREAAATTTTLVAGGCEVEKPRPPVVAAAPEDEAETLADELMPHHPWQGNRPRAIAAIRRVLAERPDAIDQIRRSHEAARPHWEEQRVASPRAFRPSLATWIEEGNWKSAAAAIPERKPVQSETWLERRKREQGESEDELYRDYAELGMWQAIRECGGDEAVEIWREKIKQIA